MKLAGLTATVVRPTGPETAPPALLMHGMGLGRWIWARTQARLAEAGVPSVAIDLPGHGEDRRNIGLTDLIDAATEAAAQLPGCALVGHSMGGYAAQVVASRLSVHGLVLIGAFPTAGIRYVPTRSGLKLALKYGAPLLMGRSTQVSFDDYLVGGLSLVESERQREVWGQITPWPARLPLELIRRPHRVERASILAPIVSMCGRKDSVVRWQVGRAIGEHFGALTWRYDDLGHLAMLQPEGVRLERDLADWLITPRRRRVTEVQTAAGAAPSGEARSAYGQRAGREGERPMAPWDQNLAG